MNFIEFLSSIVQQKDDAVEKLISILKSTDDFSKGNQIALTLIDHFRDERIENCLIDLIKSPKWRMHNGTLLYALSECTNDSKHLYFLIDLILKNEKDNNGEIFMSACSMIVNLQPPLNKKEVAKSIQRLKREEKKKNITEEQKKLVNSLLNFLEVQKEIKKFYDQYEMQ